MPRWMFFEILFLGTCGYALWRGAGPERIAAVTFLISATLTVFLRQSGVSLVPQSPSFAVFAHIEIGVLIVDSTMLVIFVGLARLSQRFWPIWMAALQGIIVLTHFTMLLRLDIIPWAYWRSQALWSYPMLAVLLVATWRHRRRLKSNGADPSWRRSFAR